MSAAEPRRTPEQAKLDAPAEMLARDLPPTAARATATFLILLFVAAALASALVEVPETVSCAFVLAPPEGADPIRSTWRGVVETVGAGEGQEIPAGHPLYRIRSSEIRTLATERASLEKEAAGARERLKNASAEFASQGKADDEEAGRLQARAQHLAAEALGLSRRMELRKAAAEAARRLQVATIVGLAEGIPLKREAAKTYQEYLTRMAEAQRGGSVSWEEFFSRKLAKERADEELDAAVRGEQMARLKLEHLEAEARREEAEESFGLERLAGERQQALSLREKLKAEAAARKTAQAERERALGTEIETMGLKLAGLAKELEGTERDLAVIVAPYAATVLSLRSRGVGDVVERGQELCQLARAGGPLQAELAVPEAAAGRLRAGMEVKLLYAAFPHQRYGVHLGELTWVSPGTAAGRDAAGGREAAAFRAFAAPAEAEIRVGGEPRPLRAGMGGEARVIVGRRTLIEYAFEPLRILRDAVR